MELTILTLLGAVAGAVAYLVYLLHPRPVVEAVPQAPTPKPVPPPREPQVVVRLFNEKGRALGLLKMPVSHRRSKLRHRTSDGALGVFIASKLAEDGSWKYRRVGVEREH